MTNDQLKDLLDFEEPLTSAEILKEYECADSATFIVARLQYPDGATMTVPFVHFAGEDWLFTPCDWQDWTPDNPEDIDKITWRVDDTETEGVMFMGLPRLAPIVPEEPNPKRYVRKKIGRLINEAREARGLSIRALAEIAGVDKSQICRIEGGRLNASIDTITALADALGMEIGLCDKE